VISEIFSPFPLFYEYCLIFARNTDERNETTHRHYVENKRDKEGIVIAIEGILPSHSSILLSQTVFIFIINVYYLL